MCYTYIVPTRYDRLDDALARIRLARQRPAWRNRILSGTDGDTKLSTLRVLRAVEQREEAGDAASVRDIADYLGVDHSTASRTVAGVVACGLLAKSADAGDPRRRALLLTDSGRARLSALTLRRRRAVAQTVADWDTTDVDTLVALLERLADAFERNEL